MDVTAVYKKFVDEKYRTFTRTIHLKIEPYPGLILVLDEMTFRVMSVTWSLETDQITLSLSCMDTPTSHLDRQGQDATSEHNI